MSTLNQVLKSAVGCGLLCTVALLLPSEAARAQNNGGNTIRIESVQTTPTVVHRGQTGILVSVTVRNNTAAMYRLAAGGLDITGSSTNASYIIRAVPGQNWYLLPGVATTFMVNVTVRPDAPLGTATLDAHVNVVFVAGPPGTSDRIGVKGAVQTDAWDVQQ